MGTKAGPLAADTSDWPTYRHDARRSGATECAVVPHVKIAWTADIGSVPSAAVVARGMGKPCVAGCGELFVDSAKMIETEEQLQTIGLGVRGGKGVVDVHLVADR